MELLSFGITTSHNTRTRIRCFVKVKIIQRLNTAVGNIKQYSSIRIEEYHDIQ